MTRFLVIQHEDSCPPEWFGAWWAAEGVDLDVRRGHRGDEIPADCSGHDALLVLGGEMDADADAAHPWLPATRALIAATVGTKPFFGICLGHQLATLALGGRTGRNDAGYRNGLTPVTRTDAMAGDDLFAALPEGAVAVHWNQDVVLELPADAEVLAATDDGAPQVVRFGPRAWGVQFHPELSPALYRRWSTDKPEDQWPADAAAKADAVAAEGAHLGVVWSAIARRFVEVARGEG